MTVSIGDKFNVCIPYIVGVVDTCHVKEVKTEDDVKLINIYLKSKRYKVTKL